MSLLRNHFPKMLLGAAILGSGVSRLGCGLFSEEIQTIMKGYGNDFFLPIVGYSAARSAYGPINKIINKLTNSQEKISLNAIMLTGAAVSFGGCSLFELFQKAGLYHGIYDPKDFLAYAAGTLTALGLDILFSRNSKNLEMKVGNNSVNEEGGNGQLQQLYVHQF